ncbi:hypothetical protein Taro_052595 [Colocasia esculenta]|uniref:Uncharacterized protein n=1 Tax=Colocasia esculenta TaxID=4460 RepID=A0A843XIV2_COLES|nr:hypothetical protein [Colocasia esculenta]
MMDLQKRRVQLVLFVAGLVVLSMTAEKFRELVGEEAASKSGKFTFLNCFDMGSGSLACSAKEGVKLYVYTIRSSHVEKVRRQAIEVALTEAMSGGLNPSAAAKQAEKAGAKAAKLASRQAKRILGPIISSGWDFFEAVYFGGTMTEGFLRGAGTLVGTYVGGFLGEERLGRVGYLMGSHLGSWIGGRIGLMVYDVVNGVSYLVQFVQTGESTGTSNEDSSYRSEEMNFETRTEDAQVEYHGTETNPNYGQDAEPEATYENPEASNGWGFL